MKHERDLDHLTTLLGQCLGRIDERAYRLQQENDGEVADDTDADGLENDAATLQEVISALLDGAAVQETCDLNRIVGSAVSACMQELATPIVVRQRLAPDVPPIACTPGQLAYAAQRALVIAAGRLTAGGELTVTTRRDDDCPVLEIESSGGERDSHLHERAETLCEFVATFRGHCRVDCDEQHNLLIAIELPIGLVIDER